MNMFIRFFAACIFVVATGFVDAAPASLDTVGFGGGTGKVVTSVSAQTDTASALLIQPDGKLIVAGHCGDNLSSSSFCIARFLATGGLDNSFGSSGVATTAPGNGLNLAYAAALQPDGKILVAGGCDIDPSSTVTTNAFCSARFNGNGSLDTTGFGVGGHTITTFGISSSTATARSLALQPDGKIIAAGVCNISVNFRFCLARYNTDGSLDASGFGVGGKIDIGFGVYAEATALALQPDGKIVVAGLCAASQTCVARLSASGALDASGFGNNGTTTLNFVAGDERINAIAIQPDGKIVVAGYCLMTNYVFCLGRLNSDGTADLLGFGSGGLAVSSLGSGNASANAFALQPDGKIVAAGNCVGASNGDFCLARFHSDGSHDLGFGIGGTLVSAIGTGDDRASAVLIQPDGKIVVAGSCNGASFTDFCLARYQGGPFGGRNCSMDVDGDGVVRADRDMLIALRVSLGLRGNDVLNNISFASHASRQSWPAIRDYLSTQCAMKVLP